MIYFLIYFISFLISKFWMIIHAKSQENNDIFFTDLRHLRDPRDSDKNPLVMNTCDWHFLQTGIFTDWHFNRTSIFSTHILTNGHFQAKPSQLFYHPTWVLWQKKSLAFFQRKPIKSESKVI